MNANELMIGDWVYAIDGNGEKHPGRANSLEYDYINKRDNFSVDFYGTNYDPEWPDIAFYVEPIPLAPEILEKNGFEMVSKRDDDAGTVEKYFYPRIGYVYRFSNGEWEVDLIGYGRGFSGAAKYRGVIKYVHELQHIFRILKLEKEIEL